MNTQNNIEQENLLFYSYNVAGITGTNTCNNNVLCSENTFVTDLNE